MRCHAVGETAEFYLADAVYYLSSNPATEREQLTMQRHEQEIQKSSIYAVLTCVCAPPPLPKQEPIFPHSRGHLEATAEAESSVLREGSSPPSLPFILTRVGKERKEGRVGILNERAEEYGQEKRERVKGKVKRKKWRK